MATQIEIVVIWSVSFTLQYDFSIMYAPNWFVLYYVVFYELIWPQFLRHPSLHVGLCCPFTPITFAKHTMSVLAVYTVKLQYFDSRSAKLPCKCNDGTMHRRWLCSAKRAGRLLVSHFRRAEMFAHFFDIRLHDKREIQMGAGFCRTKAGSIIRIRSSCDLHFVGRRKKVDEQKAQKRVWVSSVERYNFISPWRNAPVSNCVWTFAQRRIPLPIQTASSPPRMVRQRRPDQPSPLRRQTAEDLILLNQFVRAFTAVRR